MNVVWTSGLHSNEYFSNNFDIFFSQARRGTSGGRATENVTVTGFINAVIFIIGAFANVYAIDFVVVITFAVVRG